MTEENDDPLKICLEKRREEKRDVRTYSTYVRVQRSIIVSKDLWDSARTYAHFLEITTSLLTEKALMEFMVKHASELPVKASFNLVPIPEKPKLCGVRGCKDPAVSAGVYRPENREYALCEIHLAEFRDMPEIWQVERP